MCSCNQGKNKTKKMSNDTALQMVGAWNSCSFKKKQNPAKLVFRIKEKIVSETNKGQNSSSPLHQPYKNVKESSSNRNGRMLISNRET